MIQIDEIAATNREVLADLDKRESSIAFREAKARAILDACANERKIIDAERSAISTAEAIYRRLLCAPPRVEPLDASEPQSRARVGTQRYLMLGALRAGGRLSTDALMNATNLSARRIRDQMRADTADGFVALEEELYVLTDKGNDLLNRFEAYKRNKGEPLPSLDGPIADDEREGDIPNHTTEGATMDG